MSEKLKIQDSTINDLKNEDANFGKEIKQVREERLEMAKDLQGMDDFIDYFKIEQTDNSLL